LDEIIIIIILFVFIITAFTPLFTIISAQAQPVSQCTLLPSSYSRICSPLSNETQHAPPFLALQLSN